MEREAQASPLQANANIAISAFEQNKDTNQLLEAHNFLNNAILYSKMNIKTFPVKKQGKSPLCQNGFKSATTELSVLQTWNKQFPDCNIGIPTGAINNIFVVDIDGEIGAKSLATLEEKYGKLNAPTVLTGKGKHLYFKMPEHIEIKSSVSKIADHIDIRGNGGYVVAPPSVHENGKRYQWINFDFSQGFPQAPEWLLELISNPEQNQTKIDTLLEEIANAPEGTRNDTLLRNSIKINNLTKKEFLDMDYTKKDIINAAVESGLPKTEAERTVNNALNFVEQNCYSVSDTEPDMDILKTKIILPAPRLNTKLFGDLEEWIVKTAENTNAPVDYVAFSLLAGAAGVVGLSRTISPWEGWIEPCCLWLGAVGEPSSGKTPATKPVREILNKIEEERKQPYFAKLATWKRIREVAKQKKKEWEDKVKENPDSAPIFPSEAIAPTKPQTYSFVYGDATPEIIMKNMKNNIKGAILFRDELSGWICGMNRYNSGSSERGFWLEAFNGNKFVCDRVKYDDERIEIPNLLISVFGTIQPERLVETVLSERGDGFLARFLWVYPDVVAPAIPQNNALPTTALEAFIKLDSLLNPYLPNAENQKKCLILSPEAKEFFGNWFINHRNKCDKEESISKYFLGKGQGYVLKIALLFELLKWASANPAYDTPTEVGIESVKAAIELFDSYLTPMCERVYNMYYSPSRNIEARALARWIVENKPQSFILRDVYYSGTLKNLSRKEQAEKAANRLVALNWLNVTSSRSGTTKGRTRKTYYVNPEVYALAENY